MRKGNFSLGGLTSDQIPTVDESMSFLSTVGVSVPDYAIVCFVIVRKEAGKIKGAFFENPSDFIPYYTKLILFERKDDAALFYFVRTKVGEKWFKSQTPVLISAHVETRLRG